MPTALPEPLRHGPFAFVEARDAGVARSRLRARDILHAHHGVYDSSHDADLVSRCERMLPLLGPHTWFSHATAARLWGIPLPDRATGSGRLHVITVADRPPVRRPGVVGWESEVAAIDGRMLGLLPVVAPADVWAQLAVPGSLTEGPLASPTAHADDRWLVAAADYLVSGEKRGGIRHPLCTLDDLRAAAERRRGRRGVRALMLALDAVRQPVDSPGETFTRLDLIDHGLPEPRTQVPVMTREGLRHLDLGYERERVGIEYQGDEHRASRSRWLSDLTRIQLIQDAGWRLVLVGAADLHPDASRFAGRVRRLLSP